MSTLFELCTEQEWAGSVRGQHRGGPKPAQHEDIAAAIRYLASQKVGTRVKVKCSEDVFNLKRDAARDHAYRHGISVTTRRGEGCVLIEFTR